MVRIGEFTLNNGRVYHGESFAWAGTVMGEAVFNTGMVGYVEALTDPSYAGQILILTYPLIGNYGVPMRRSRNPFDGFESAKIQVAGLVIANDSSHFSHWRGKISLANWLMKNKIPALTGIDTRAVTQELRQYGTQGATLRGGTKSIVDFTAKEKELVSMVSTKRVLVHRAGRRKVVLIDCGVKMSIINNFLQRHITVVQVPWNYNVLGMLQHIDGVVISNGPGNPKDCQATITQVKKIVAKNIPTLGICLGHQLLGLATGAKTYKLKFGHRSQNQPCIDSETGRCYLTSQNHGYAVQRQSIKKPWRVWFENANDGTVEGLRHAQKPFYAVQFHPEANPGPHDTNFIFDTFVKTLS